MSFDVGIGKCRSVSGESVDVWVDGSVVRRIVPESEWQQAGVSVLRVPLSLCSKRRPVAMNEEVFLGSELVGQKSSGLLDIHGSGDFVRIALANLVPVIEETALPPATRKPNWR